MDRLHQLITVTAVGSALLVVCGCEQPAPPGAAGPIGGAPTLRGDLPARARQIVVNGLADPNPQIRVNAIEVVASARQMLLMPKVQTLLQDEVVPVRFVALLAVGDLEYKPAGADVVRLLEDPDPNVRMAAAYAMTRLGRPEYYEVISRAVASTDQTVRANAALLLGKSGRHEGLRPLYWTLRRDDSADKVVLQATEAIAILGDRRIYPRLWSRLISAYADDRVLGIRAMGALGTDQAKSALVTMLDDPVAEVRVVAAEQLGKLGDAAGEAQVLKLLETDFPAAIDARGRERLKVLIALAVGEIGTEPIARYLPSLLRDDSARVRLAAAQAVLRQHR